jgi:hypothetical protein
MRGSLIPLVLLLGCGHSEPFVADGPAKLNRPFRNTTPLQLTLNLGADATPSWTQDGSGIYWSAERPLPGDLDRCISLLPATGGTLTELQCPPNFNDTTTRYETPAVNGTRLVWTRNQARSGPFSFHQFSLWSATTTSRSTPQLLQTFPYNAPSGLSHDLPLFLQWLKPGLLLYLGAQSAGCCADDTLRFGEQVVLLDLNGPAPVRTFVPGTDRASAVAGSDDGNTIYYTFPGDSVVYRQLLASGDVSSLHNFGQGHVVRDPTVSGNLLVAIVDGRPRAQDLPPFGVVNVDFGGDLIAVDLTTGVETPLFDTSHWFRRPRFAPGGGRFVVEGFPYVITYIPIGGNQFIADTTVSLINDLWVWEG